MLVDSHAGRCDGADGCGGQRREINGGNGVRAGVGDNREIGFLVDGHAAWSGADIHADGFPGSVQDRNAVHQVKNGDRVCAIVGDHGNARGCCGLPGIGKPGKNGHAGGRVAGGDSLDGLIKNVCRVQAEDRNLVAARARVGYDREIIDFIDGHAARSGRSAVRSGGGDIAGCQRNFFKDSEVRYIRTDTRTVGDGERIVAGAGIEHGHGNGYIDFPAADQREIAQCRRGYGNAVQQDLRARVKTRAENLHAADGGWRCAQGDLHGSTEACRHGDISAAGVYRRSLDALNVNGSNGAKLETGDCAAPRVHGQNQIIG